MIVRQKVMILVCLSLLSVASLAPDVLASDAPSLIYPLGGPEDVLLHHGDFYEHDEREVEHQGIDIAARAGAKVLATAAGTVSYVGPTPGQNGGEVNCVTIENDRYKMTFRPISPSVGEGQVVEVSEEVGVLEEYGDHSTSEPHLNFTLRPVDGRGYLDPEDYLVVADIGLEEQGAGESSAEMEVVGESTEPSVSPVSAEEVLPREAPQVGEVELLEPGKTWRQSDVEIDTGVKIPLSPSGQTRAEISGPKRSQNAAPVVKRQTGVASSEDLGGAESATELPVAIAPDAGRTRARSHAAGRKPWIWAGEFASRGWQAGGAHRSASSLGEGRRPFPRSSLSNRHTGILWYTLLPMGLASLALFVERLERRSARLPFAVRLADEERICCYPRGPLV